ncbi:helix-turn-helix domain-containing protein [Streptomyces luteolus]|uniref:Helix-turn-helix transcriptional regulator n=1 Tax=Streptomyces luteolus TaxID=3043615 RepID=A0ABT6SWJ4_9ACTN|nr:helix-turn-helix transcriptional regulator [Streptomyces sp. B-S-A12]MDI3419791.1 helix-turn-helix transcriptional regulator [Streptomyces sp. B-S-A12]
MADNRSDRGVSVSTVLARRLGGELLRMREGCGMRQPQAAEALSASVAKVTKMERGLVPVRDPDIRSLCQLYDVHDPQVIGRLLGLAKADRERRKAKGWWNQYPVLGAQVEYVALEDVAAQVRTHQVTLIPGLLQTPDYARALAVGCGAWEDPDEIERFVEARIARQDRLNSTPPLQLWALIGEGALRQHVGGRDVMRGQLEYLLKLTDRPNIKVQVLPFLGGAHAGMQGAFNIISFAEVNALDVVYLDTPSSSLWLESEQDAARHTAIFDRTARNSLAQADSRSLIRRVIKEL